MRVLTVIGNRPQFVKAAAVSFRLREAAEEVLVHTGQHYDAELSQVFFDELELPRPEHLLDLGGGTNTEQTGRMLGALGAAAGRRAPRRGARLRRHQLDAGGRAGRRADADPGRPRGGGDALVRPHDARGAQPRPGRPRLRPAAVLLRDAGRAPAPRERLGRGRGGRRRDGRRRAAAGAAGARAHRRCWRPARSSRAASCSPPPTAPGTVDDPERLERLVALLAGHARPGRAAAAPAHAGAAGGRRAAGRPARRRPACGSCRRSATWTSPRCCCTRARC